MSQRTPGTRGDGLQLSRYLTLAGTWRPKDESFSLTPSFLTEYGDVAPEFFDVDGEQALVAELFDDRARLVWRAFVPMSRICADPVESERFAVAAKVPFPDTTKTLRLSLLDRVVFETEVSEATPNVSITWKPSFAAQATGIAKITWEGNHPKGLALHYVVVYSNDAGATWQPLSIVSPETTCVVNFDELPGGKGRIGIVTTDGINTTWTWSDTFAVEEKGYVATILRPVDGSLHDASTPLRLEGQGYQLESGIPELRRLTWSTAAAGVIGEGAVAEWRDPPPGSHEIALQVAGVKSEHAIATARVDVIDRDPAPV